LDSFPFSSFLVNKPLKRSHIPFSDEGSDPGSFEEEKKLKIFLKKLGSASDFSFLIETVSPELLGDSDDKAGFCTAVLSKEGGCSATGDIGLLDTDDISIFLIKIIFFTI
jgi:hypothetical protein